MGKISKKIPEKLFGFVQSIKPNVSKNTSYDEAWQIIAEYFDIEGEIGTDHKGNTKFTIFKNDKEISSINIPNVFDKECGDWEWTILFKTTIEHLIKNKIIKKPRSSSNNVKNVSPTQNNIIYNKKSSSNNVYTLDECKRLKSSLYQKIREWKNKGKDTSLLEEQYKQIQETIKSMK